MQRRNTSAHRHHHRHHHHSRRLQADSNETPGIDEEAERERLPKKEKRVYRSSLRTHKSHRRQDDTDAGATRSDPDAHSQIKYTGKGSAEDDTVVSHPYNSSQTHRQAVEEKRTRTSDSLKVSTEGSAAKRTPMSDAKRSSPQALLLKMFRPAASMSERRLCHGCLRRIFTLSITDPQHMPPRCCTSDHIPLKHVEKLFDYKFKLKWNRKYREYTTKNRVYCPSRGCGRWIPPSNIFTDTSSSGIPGRKYGICGRCKVKVCCVCNRKWHRSGDCPLDEGSIKFAEVAAQEGWQRCFSCSAMVELKEGCNHITCRCTAQFCIVCGSKWKTCDCPWFNYNDSLGGPDIPGEFRRPILYREEIDRRHQQEEEDEALARQLQGLLNLDMPPDPHNPRVYIQPGR
ncbi:hypothetical protein McanMca71_006223 [Microsporum canis]